MISKKDGRPAWAFIHGNWCLANARRDGRNCGVDDELVVLHKTGCYADFTFAAAPNEAQPRFVNQIYWPTGDLTKKRAYENGEVARRYIAVVGRPQNPSPEVDATISAMRLGLGLKSCLFEQGFDNCLKASPLDHVEHGLAPPIRPLLRLGCSRDFGGSRRRRCRYC